MEKINVLLRPTASEGVDAYDVDHQRSAIDHERKLFNRNQTDSTFKFRISACNILELAIAAIAIRLASSSSRRRLQMIYIKFMHARVCSHRTLVSFNLLGCRWRVRITSYDRRLMESSLGMNTDGNELGVTGCAVSALLLSISCLSSAFIDAPLL